MTEWGVFVVIAALVSFAVAIVTPILKLNTNITRLTVTIENILYEQEETKIANGKSHDRIWKELEEHGGQLGDHETRITKIEERNKANAK